ncbi:MAG: hypothetical protein AMJ60_00055 [Desulfobacterales bacterium SG8_35]|nr:MAG: hypothetical protein AMJ60_00055 [Desulfobacterales bacterium SG8_35]
MDFPFLNCITSAENFSARQVMALLEYHHDMTYILFNLQKFDEEIQKITEKKMVAHYLSTRELDNLAAFSSDKRKREWLGGRFAAKFAAAGALVQRGNPLPWSGLTVLADKNGRPFLAADTKSTALPDISISHSGSMAAAMAVSKGFCGIDIQKVTDRVVKVRERFCSPDEEHIIQSFFSASGEKQSSALTRLWAAKEALRKAANTSSLPGFLELELTEINKGSAFRLAAPWRFVFMWNHRDLNGYPVTEKCYAAVSLIADYALALTARNDSVI